MQHYLQHKGQLGAQEAICVSISCGHQECLHSPIHVPHPTFNVVDVNPVPQLSLQSQMASIYF